MVSIFLPIFVQFLESIQRCGKAMSWSASNWRPFDKPILPKRRRPRPRFSTYFTESDPIFFFSTFVGLHLKNQSYQEGKWEFQHVSQNRIMSRKDPRYKWNCLCISGLTKRWMWEVRARFVKIFQHFWWFYFYSNLLWETIFHLLKLCSTPSPEQGLSWFWNCRVLTGD